MSATGRAIVVGSSFLFIFLSGLWLSRAGRPLNTSISTLHKLISLAAGIFLGVTIHKLNQVVTLGTEGWIAVAVAGLCAAGAVASGAALSFERPAPTALLRVHQVLPVLTALSTGMVLYFLLGSA